MGSIEFIGRYWNILYIFSMSTILITSLIFYFIYIFSIYPHSTYFYSVANGLILYPIVTLGTTLYSVIFYENDMKSFIYYMCFYSLSLIIISIYEIIISYYINQSILLYYNLFYTILSLFILHLQTIRVKLYGMYEIPLFSQYNPQFNIRNLFFPVNAEERLKWINTDIVVRTYIPIIFDNLYRHLGIYLLMLGFIENLYAIFYYPHLLLYTIPNYIIGTILLCFPRNLYKTRTKSTPIIDFPDLYISVKLWYSIYVSIILYNVSFNKSFPIVEFITSCICLIIIYI